MTTKVKGTEGIEFPDATVQASAARPVTKGAFVNLPAAPTYTVAIPAGKQSITAYLRLATAAGSSPLPVFRIGTISAIANTGYSVCYWRSAHQVVQDIGFDTTGLLIFSNTPSASVTGKLELTLMDAATNTWNFDYSGRTSDGFLNISNGTCVLPGELRQLQLTSFAGSNLTGGQMSVDWS